jgi:hypothetical protein
MKRILLVVAVALVAACATNTASNPSAFPADAEPVPPQDLLERHYQVNRIVHPASGDTLTELVVQANFLNHRVACSNLKSPPVRVTLMLRKHAPAGGPVLTLLSVDYEAPTPLGPDGDRALHLRLDRATLIPVRYGNATRAMRHSARESMQYVVTAAQLHEIVRAERTSARLSGRAGKCDFPISGQARGLMAMFADRELAGAEQR